MASVGVAIGREDGVSVRNERGFTVVEAVITLFMIGAIGATTLSLLTSQDRFYGRLDDAVIAEQSLRAIADLTSSEIRMSVPEDIFVAVPESVTFALDVYQGVVCDVNAGAGQAYVFVYDTVPNPNVSGPIGFAYKDPYVTTYRVARGWTAGTSLGGSAQTICQNARAPTGAPAYSYRTVSGWPSGFAGDTPERGAIVRKFRELSYRFGPSSMGSDYALFRGPQELAGPFDPTSSFSYVMDDGSIQTTVATSDLDRIRRVRVNAIAIDDDPRFDLQRVFDLEIPLRY